MAATPANDPHVTDTDTDIDLIVIGGGPAGCAAALTAAGVGMRSVLVEQDDVLCRNLHRIPALNNVLGGHTNGPDLADSIAKDLARTPLCHLEMGRRATQIQAFDDHVAITLDTDVRLTAPHAVLATGVGPLQPRHVPWITALPELTLPPLWQEPINAEGRTLLVLGGDRPIGTFLRAHPDTDTQLLVAYPANDDYKVDEIRDDPRVTLLPVQHVTLHPTQGPTITADMESRDGQRNTVSGDAAFLSLGSAPTAPPGDLARDAAGYCPPSQQHPRIVVAGDLRSARFQRIMTAIGSGSEAALRAYYVTR
ncbi:FAD-dependent oxidoreductase [Streptomyces sp. NPDC093707]|uniref:FAD-dependent oxidoreductase n=1 Tax=Streptomyces sp. NPDC093707 TaxID=3154984 RepID=UPI00344BCBD8